MSQPRQGGGTDEEPQPMVVGAAVKLKCSAYLLAIVAAGFALATIEVENSSKVFPCPTDDSTACSVESEKERIKLIVSWWIGWAAKVLCPLTTILAISYLHCRVLVEGEVPRAMVALSHPRRTLILTKVSHYIKMLESLGSYPSRVFVITFLLFFILYCVSIVIEIFTGQGNEDIHQYECKKAGIVRRILLLVSTLYQTRFFFVNCRSCIQWKLTASWFCTAHIMATNIVCWFFTVALEVREVDSHKQPDLDGKQINCTKLTDLPVNLSMDAFSRVLYPFAIEYYVMSALMAYTLMTNTGRMGSFLQRHVHADIGSEERLLQEVHPKVHGRPHGVAGGASESATLRQHSVAFFFGLGLIVTALVVSAYRRLTSSDENCINAIDIIFQWTLILFYICGFVLSIALFCALGKDSNRQLSSSHLTDRALLWLGAAAIMVNDAHTFFKTWAKLNGIGGEGTKAYYYYALLMINSGMNVVQSLLQVLALECALVRKLPSNQQGNQQNAGAGGSVQANETDGAALGAGGRAHAGANVPADGYFQGLRRCMRENLHGRAVLNVLILLNIAEWIINAICFNFFFPKGKINDSVVLSLVTMPLQVFYRFHSAACMYEFKKHCETESEASQAGDTFEADFMKLMQSGPIEDHAEDH